MAWIFLCFKMKKGEQRVHLFCPKSTINLTYLCYGDSNIGGHIFNILIYWINDLYISLSVESTSIRNFLEIKLIREWKFYLKYYFN